MAIPVTPTSVDDFTEDWVKFVMSDWFNKNEKEVDKVKITDISASMNGLQGMLSTTYIVDVKFEYNGEEEEKSIFVKVPLIGEVAKNLGMQNIRVNERESEMYKTVLPTLQKFLDENCEGFFRLPMPEVLYCHYSGDETHDAFVLENLVSSGYTPYADGNLTEEYLRSVLECLAQLHGTGLAFKKSVGGNEGLLNTFPKMEQQIQIKDIVEDKDARKFLRRHFVPFLQYLEKTDEGLKNHTSYMRKMQKHLFKILKVLEDSGVEKLVTFCHGDAKPNNFMFRKIEIDIEDLECEGIEGILIDWQAAFLGSISNDLMWVLFPFVEANKDNKNILPFGLKHYFQELKVVMESFHTSLEDFQLPDDDVQFEQLVKRGIVLEFLNVTVLRPILNVKEPEKLKKWFRKFEIHEQKVAEGKRSKMPKLPPQQFIFQSPRFVEFVHLYFKVATSLGGFQEMAKIYFEVMRDAMFDDDKDKDELIEEDEESVVIIERFSKDWWKSFCCGCCKGK